MSKLYLFFSFVYIFDNIGRNRSSTSGDRPNHSIMASTAASTEESGAELNRTRTSSHDVPKSKFLMGGASPLRHQARSGSTGRSVKNNNNNNNSVTTGNGAGKISSSRLPILAMGRSDSMAQYYTVVDEETRLAEALESSHALENSSHSAKKGGVGGEAYQVGVQRSTSADSDFGLLLYDEDDARRKSSITLLFFLKAKFVTVLHNFTIFRYYIKV